MKKLLLLLVILSMFSTASLVSAEKKSDEVSPKEAVAAALYQVVETQHSGVESNWNGKNVRADQPIEVYDQNGELLSYIVNLHVGNNPAGYVEIANNPDDFPVLSFSETGNQMDSDTVTSLESSVKKNGSAKKIKKSVVSVYPGKFGLKVDYDDNESFLALDNEDVQKLTPESKKPHSPVRSSDPDSKVVWGKIKKLATGEIGTTSDGVTDDLSFETGYTAVYPFSYNGVGDLYQVTSSLWTGLSGCTPTSAYNIMIYWAFVYGYSDLIKDVSGNYNQDQSILGLRGTMNTNNLGWTDIFYQVPGLKDYARIKGYTKSTSVMHTNPSWSTVKTDIESGPILLTLISPTFYNENHTVTGVGYREYVYNGSTTNHQYMLVHDNWGTTVTDVFIAYGRNYTGIYTTTFKPIK